MAGLGFKDFAVGEVLTAADVDGYLMQQSVMRFADSAARGSALGTAVGTATALAEGMVAYLDDANVVEVFNGSAWVRVAPMKKVAAFTASGTWTVPTNVTYAIAHMVGGGGGVGNYNSPGSAGGDSSVVFASGTAVAKGGSGTDTALAGDAGAATQARAGANNSGQGAAIMVYASVDGSGGGMFAGDGARVTEGATVTPAASITVTVGAGGSAGTQGAAGGSGYVWIEYYE